MKFTLILGCLLMMACGICFAADNAPPARAFPGGAPTPPPEAPAFTKIIPLVNFDQLPLDQVIMALQQDQPDFQAVIRYSSDSQDMPNVKLKLKNVTVPQVLDVLSKKYGWGIEPVKAAGQPPIYVIAVRSQKSPEWSVSAYCLTPIIDQLMERKGYNPIEGQEKTDEMRKKDRSALLADVVATVDTAVKMASDGAAVEIQVHEPTEMLIINAMPKQREAAERVLKALDPGNTVVKADGVGIPHRADPFFGGGAGSSSAGSVDPSIAREIEKMQMLEAQQAQGKVDQAEADIVRRLYEKRIRELQQEAIPAPATRPHEAPPAPPKN